MASTAHRVQIGARPTAARMWTARGRVTLTLFYRAAATPEPKGRGGWDGAVQEARVKLLARRTDERSRVPEGDSAPSSRPDGVLRLTVPHGPCNDSEIIRETAFSH